MDREAAKQIILNAVTDLQGCKSTELAIRLGSNSELMAAFPSIDIAYMIDELISEKKVVDISYTLPNIPHKIKTFLLPKGSKVTITK